MRVLVSVGTALITERRGVQEECCSFVCVKKELQHGVQVYLLERSRTGCGLTRPSLHRRETRTYVCFFCIPPLTSSNALQVGLQWETLEFEVQQFMNMGDVVVMGDLNVPCTLYYVSGSLPRVSQDNTVNMYV